MECHPKLETLSLVRISASLQGFVGSLRNANRMPRVLHSGLGVYRTGSVTIGRERHVTEVTKFSSRVPDLGAGRIVVPEEQRASVSLIGRSRL